MTLSCTQTRDRFERYAAETLDREQRRAVREHLAGCASCRSESIEADPLFVFAGITRPEVPEEETSRVLEAVRAGIALKQAEKRIGPPARRRWGALASAAAALVLTLSLPGAAARRQAADIAAAPPDAAGAGMVPAAAPAPSLDVPGRPAGGQKYPADATIYDWNPGAGQPRVVWIVDQSIDI